MIPSIAHLILLLLGTIPFVTTDLPLFARACRKALSLWNHLEDSEEEYELWVNKAFGDSCDATNGHFNNGGSRLWLYLEDDSLRMTFQSLAVTNFLVGGHVEHNVRTIQRGAHTRCSRR
eukprot:GHVS01106899.1.p1 GENE.GHVS01106899.1~~GHVS01106899.1.p1  ORF type:complete len:119 (-),score=3.04 GHVS01106899.1:359-715(-)